ncbi:MAG TPA: hypothetical protein VIG99_05585 [Myxococcaceae bacterium]|jgi:DMSO/TMAO reductase YedYZ molybdopterin-dependent catalytic subunit
MRSHRTALSIAAWLLIVPAAALADAPSLEVAGALAKTGPLTLKDLEAMKPEKATWTDHGKAQEVEGVPLGRILAAFGFERGPMGKDVPAPDKRPGYKKVVRVTAKDGFQAIFSCAELAEDMGPTRALLIWKLDGKPLPADQAPFRLVVLTDKEPSRSPYAVQKIEVIDLRNAAR